jgi:hypothetical protein
VTFFESDGGHIINPDLPYFEVSIAPPVPEDLNFLPSGLRGGAPDLLLRRARPRERPKSRIPSNEDIINTSTFRFSICVRVDEGGASKFVARSTTQPCNPHSKKGGNKKLELELTICRASEVVELVRARDRDNIPFSIVFSLEGPGDATEDRAPRLIKEIGPEWAGRQIIFACNDVESGPACPPDCSFKMPWTTSRSGNQRQASCEFWSTAAPAEREALPRRLCSCVFSWGPGRKRNAWRNS